MQPSSHSVTLWIEQLRASDPVAARKLWQRFFARMVAVARQRLASGTRRVADEEDAALSAFLAFQRGAQEGRFPNLTNRDELWNLLFILTTRAAAGQLRRERRAKRGGGHPGDAAALANVIDDSPRPDEEAAFQDDLAHALETLGDEQLRQIALARLEGRSIEEIAQSMSLANVTIRRRLAIIRLTWQDILERSSD
jgi:DNA-directed RNA polymerase specialized sigma24 family protein